MSTYLKHMGGYTYKQLKGKSFDKIQKLFDKEMKRVNTFVAMGFEVQKNKEKKEEVESETVKVAPQYYYSATIRFWGCDKIVKGKYGDTRPEDEFERVLYGDLRVMFEPDIKSDVWRMLQGYRVTTWKLIDSYGVHFDNESAAGGIEDIDADVDVSLVDETQERQDDDLIFDTGVLDDVEMPVEAKTKDKGVVVLGASEFRVPKMIKPSSSKDNGKRLLAERLQSKEREELTHEEKAKLFMELMEKRRNHFAAFRAQEKRNKTSNQGTKRKLICPTYLMHMGKQRKEGRSYRDEEQLIDPVVA
ncbi:hypothetical protein Tco_0399877 [Tanacetum coccineum]